MNRSIAAVFALFFLSTASQIAAQDMKQACNFCGMDRQKFAHSAMVIEYEDGSGAGTCSIHCAALELALNIDKTPTQILVGDYLSKKPIIAEKACWTIGGDQPGVMTARAKWSFEDRNECEKYSKEHGAQVATFDQALNAAYEDMYADTKMIRDRRKAKRAQQGQESRMQAAPQDHGEHRHK